MEKNLFRNLKSIFILYRWRFLKAFLMILLSNLLLISNPLIFRKAVEEFSSPLRTTPIWGWAILLLTIAITAAYFNYWMRICFINDTWHRLVPCALQPFLGVGIEVEFEGRPKDLQPNKNGVSQWGVWLKTGVGY